MQVEYSKTNLEIFGQSLVARWTKAKPVQKSRLKATHLEKRKHNKGVLA